MADIEIIYTVTGIVNGVINIMGFFVVAISGQAGSLAQISVLIVIVGTLAVAWGVFTGSLKQMLSGFKGFGK